MKQHSIYGGGSASPLDSSRFTIPPIQRVEISLNVDRTTPQRVESVEGESLYIERSDFPALIQLVSGGGSVKEAFRAIEGLTIVAPFKGIVLSHPLCAPTSQVQDFSLSLLVSKSGHIENGLQDVQSRFLPPYNLTINTNAATQMLIYLPRGMRRIKRMAIRADLTGAVTQAVITDLFIQFRSQDGIAVCNGPANLAQTSDLGTAQAYPTASFSLEKPAYTLLPYTATQQKLVALLTDVPIPSSAFDIQLGLNFTNGAAPSNLGFTLYYS